MLQVTTLLPVLMYSSWHDTIIVVPLSTGNSVSVFTPVQLSGSLVQLARWNCYETVSVRMYWHAKANYQSDGVCRKAKLCIKAQFCHDRHSSISQQNSKNCSYSLYPPHLMEAACSVLTLCLVVYRLIRILFSWNLETMNFCTSRCRDRRLYWWSHSRILAFRCS